MPPDTGGSMTLAIELAAARRLANPATAITEAKSWARYVGVVSEEQTYVITQFARSHRLDLDFFSGPGQLADSLSRIAKEFSAPRYVFVHDPSTTESTGPDDKWEYLPIEAAAEAAGWELQSDETVANNGQPDSTHDDWP